MSLRLFVFSIFQFIGASAFGQTCCSAGAPVSAFLEIAEANEKSISIQLNYEYKSINLLVDNNNRLENDQRSRYGQNLSIKLDYTFNTKWAFSVVLPFVYHSRNTFSENQNSFGVGDLSVLTQYKIFSNETDKLSVSAGIKLPVGITNHQGSSQIILSPDMQSGSGSYDFLMGTSYSKSDFLTSFLSTNLSFIYRKNGNNDHFGKRGNFEGRSFAFGDEFVAVTGLNYLKTLKIGFLIPDLSLKMRWSTANLEQNINASNSGGNWLSLPLGISFVPDETKSIRIYSEIPIYQNLNGLQITTDYIIGVQFRYNGKGNKY